MQRRRPFALGRCVSSVSLKLHRQTHTPRSASALRARNGFAPVAMRLSSVLYRCVLERSRAWVSSSMARPWRSSRRAMRFGFRHTAQAQSRAERASGRAEQAAGDELTRSGRFMRRSQCRRREQRIVRRGRGELRGGCVTSIRPVASSPVVIQALDGARHPILSGSFLEVSATG